MFGYNISGVQEGMKKTSIKVIKRKDAGVSENAVNKNTRGKKSMTAIGTEKNERRLRRKMAQTISSWIAERRENSRIKEVSAIRNFFGDESLLSRTA